MNDTALPLSQRDRMAMAAADPLAGGLNTAASAVSWGAILAGAAGAAALSLILLILGTGLGLSSVSPFSGQGVSATTFGVSTIAWLTFTQLAASGMGGYLAGRLRSRWVSTHVDEVYFRDTAHGFLAWAVATLVTAAMLTSAIGSILGGGAQAGASMVGGAASTATTAAAAAAPSAIGMAEGQHANDQAGEGNSAMNGMGYFVDSLFRTDAAAAPAGGASAAAATPAGTPSATGTPGDTGRSVGEVARIYANAVRTGTLSGDDAKYVGQLIAQRTGMSQADAEKRATDTFARMQAAANQAAATAKDAAEKARKASSYAALWLFVSLLVGAFVASLSATFGGRRRDI